MTVRKTVEVRSWQTDYRGDLVVCAGANVDPQAAITHDTDIEPRGCTVCVVELVDIRPLKRSDAKAAMLPPGYKVTGDEFAWVLARPRPLMPRPIKGALGLFGVASDLVIPA